ncbi:MAG: IS66 family transposase, partial [Planctomycetes bacterium]|nr:IS66 family transposase [Planctomycetota bacterium]
QVRDLLARLGQNSANSSLPPSANPLQAPKPVVKKPTGRRRGAQPGHPPHRRQRLPAERVTHTVPFLPTQCRACQAPLPAEPGPQDPEPSWHQVAELPAIRAEITEYQGHARTCPGCGTLTHAPIPADLRAQVTGPRLTAALSYLSGRHHLSKRGVEELAEALFEVPLALGTVSALEHETSQALAAPHAEVVQAVQQAPAKNADETSWKLAGQLCWLWTAVTATAALFVIHARRGGSGLTALLGEAMTGIVTSDRWSAYGRLALAQRQIGWAHLRRDFQAMVDRGGAGQTIGADLLGLTGVLFELWRKVRDGTRSRAWFVRQAEAIREDVVLLLRQGRGCGCAKTAAVCREVLAVEPALWTFTRVEGVEPTNNAAERALRPAVLWRKRSFGCASAEGCRFVERMLTAVQTLRLQQRRVLDYLTEALTAHRAGLPAPKLLSAE